MFSLAIYACNRAFVIPWMRWIVRRKGAMLTFSSICGNKAKSAPRYVCTMIHHTNLRPPRL